MLNDYRSFYADELQAVANLQTAGLVRALSEVKREGFLGSGPWFIVSPDGSYRETSNDDPRQVYHDVLIAIDRSRHLNNGHPSSVCSWLDTLCLEDEETVYHVGAGVGYYTAVIAHIVGSKGHVRGIEIDVELAGRAAANLSYLSNVEVLSGDGLALAPNRVDVIFASAGFTRPPLPWLKALTIGGRLLCPITSTGADSLRTHGFMLLVTRKSEADYTAKYVSPVNIFGSPTGRNEEENMAVKLAVESGRMKEIKSLRLSSREEESDCIIDYGDMYLSALDLK